MYIAKLNINDVIIAKRYRTINIQDEQLKYLIKKHGQLVPILVKEMDASNFMEFLKQLDMLNSIKSLSQKDKDLQTAEELNSEYTQEDYTEEDYTEEDYTEEDYTEEDYTENKAEGLTEEYKEWSSDEETLQDYEEWSNEEENPFDEISVTFEGEEYLKENFGELVGEIANIEAVEMSEEDYNYMLENDKIDSLTVEGTIQTDYKYVLIDGFKRLAAMQELGYTEVIAIVLEKDDYPGLDLKLLEILSNWKIPYDYLDKEKCLYTLELYNDKISTNEKELLLGLCKGELPKFIDLLNSDIREEFITKNMSIESAYKKLEKKRKKDAEDENAKVLGEKNIENKKELGLLDEKLEKMEKFEPEQQKPGDRHPLSPELAKAVEVRDNYTCQGCGVSGITYSNIFEKHHILPVFFGGKDELSNLVLLCPTCHKLVHKYSVGLAIVEERDKLALENIIKLGDVIRKEIEKSDKPLEYYRKIFGRY